MHSINYQYLHSMRRQQRALADMADQVGRQPDMDPLVFFPTLLSKIADALEVKTAYLHLLDDEKRELHLIEQLGGYDRERLQIINTRDESTPMSRALHMAEAQCGHMAGYNLMAAPIIGVDVSLGTLTIPLPDNLNEEMREDWQSFLMGMGYLSGIALEHAGIIDELLNTIDKLQKMQHREAERARLLETHNKHLQSTNFDLQTKVGTDALTGLANRRRLMDALERIIEHSNNTGAPFCLCIADVDHFKSINDELGHQVGDQALMMLAGWLKSNVRQLDLVGRYGGEEFMIILNNCDLPTGYRIAGKLRKVVEKKSVAGPFALRGGFRMSLGVAQHEPGMSVEHLIGQADQALYRAKTAGRNRVETASSGHSQNIGGLSLTNVMQ